MDRNFSDELKRKGRTSLILFQIFNAISFNLMSGNIVALYAMNIGANTYFVGLLNSFISFSTVTMIFGKMLAPKIGLLSVFRSFWAFRYISMIPAVVSVLFWQTNNSFALLILALGVFLFAISRGIGFTGFSPMMASVVSEKDRGSFFSLIQLIFQVFGLIISILVVFILSKFTSIYTYTIFIGAGILTGVMATIPLFFFPEESGLNSKSDANVKLVESFKSAISDLWGNFKAAMKRIVFKQFLIVNSMIFFLFGMVDPFVIVFFKKVYHQTDGVIAFFVFIGMIGGVVNAYLSQKYIDKSGAKITLFLFSIIYVCIVLLLIVSPPIGNPFALSLYAGTIFFFSKLCSTGMFSSAMIYLFGVIEEKEHLNLSIIQQMTCGLGGFAGANVGGLFLQMFESHSGLSIGITYKIYFFVLLLCLMLLVFQISKLSNAGGYSIRSFFHPDSLRKIFLDR